jgi:uncharacterized protein YkwD
VRAVVAAALVAAALAGCGSSGGRAELPRSACGRVATTPERLGPKRTRELTLCLLNEERARHGLGALTENPLLDLAATAHSDDMVTRNYFEHDTPEGSTPEDRIRGTGYVRPPGRSVGENIAWGLGPKASPAAIVDHWMHSPPHRANILRAAFEEVGIGVAFGVPQLPGRRSGAGATYTTDFGGRLAAGLGTD